MVHLNETIFLDGLITVQSQKKKEQFGTSDTQTPCDAMRGTAIGIPIRQTQRLSYSLAITPHKILLLIPAIQTSDRTSIELVIVTNVISITSTRPQFVDNLKIILLI